MIFTPVDLSSPVISATHTDSRETQQTEPLYEVEQCQVFRRSSNKFKQRGRIAMVRRSVSCVANPPRIAPVDMMGKCRETAAAVRPGPTGARAGGFVPDTELPPRPPFRRWATLPTRRVGLVADPALQSPGTTPRDERRSSWFDANSLAPRGV